MTSVVVVDSLRRCVCSGAAGNGKPGPAPLLPDAVWHDCTISRAQAGERITSAAGADQPISLLAPLGRCGWCRLPAPCSCRVRVFSREASLFHDCRQVNAGIGGRGNEMARQCHGLSDRKKRAVLFSQGSLSSRSNGSVLPAVSASVDCCRGACLVLDITLVSLPHLRMVTDATYPKVPGEGRPWSSTG